MLRDSAGALKDFNAAIKLSPKSAHMYFNRGNLFASIKEYEKAYADYTHGRCLNYSCLKIRYYFLTF